MRIEDTESIWLGFCNDLGLDVEEYGSKTRVEGWCRPYQEENKKWVLVDDVISELEGVMLLDDYVLVSDPSEATSLIIRRLKKMIEKLKNE